MSRVTPMSSVLSNVRQRVTPQEWEVRVKLAAAYRLAALYKWTDHIYTHFSARVPGPEAHFLINAFGRFGDEAAAAAPGKQKAVLFQLMVGIYNCSGIDAEPGRELADGRQGIAGGELACLDELVQPCIELHVKRFLFGSG